MKGVPTEPHERNLEPYESRNSRNSQRCFSRKVKKEVTLEPHNRNSSRRLSKMFQQKVMKEVTTEIHNRNSNRRLSKMFQQNLIKEVTPEPCHGRRKEQHKRSSTRIYFQQ